MATVTGTLRNSSGQAAGADWGVKLMYKVSGVWKCALVLQTNASGEFYGTVAAGSYSPKVVYPYNATTPTYSCWATSPMPWDIVDGLNDADVVGPCVV